MALMSSAATFASSLVAGCSVTGTGSVYGGFVYGSDCTLGFIDSNVTGCTAETDGSSSYAGAMYLAEGNATFKGAIISECHAISSGGSSHAGAVYLKTDATADFENSTIANCTC